MPPTRRRQWWRDGILVGRVFGIPVLVAPSWLVSVLVIMYLAGPVITDLVPGLTSGNGYFLAAVLGVLLGVSVLLHELGHCVVARRLRMPVFSVRLFLLGGVSEIGRLPREPGEEAKVAAAGPVVSLVLAGIAAATVPAFQTHTVGWLLAVQLAVANGLIAVFNLIPALPLDGGRVLRAGVWKATGRRAAGTTAAMVGGYLVALALVVWGGFLLFGDTRAALLQGVIVIAMAGFVALGAVSERLDPPAAEPAVRADQLPMLRPSVMLPAGIPVAVALDRAAGREILLTDQYQVVVGVLDPAWALTVARTQPGTPAVTLARPMGPEQVILFSDTFREVMDVVRSSAADHFIVIGEDGQTAGVLLRRDLLPTDQPR